MRGPREAGQGVHDGGRCAEWSLEVPRREATSGSIRLRIVVNELHVEEFNLRYPLL